MKVDLDKCKIISTDTDNIQTDSRLVEKLKDLSFLSQWVRDPQQISGEESP